MRAALEPHSPQSARVNLTTPEAALVLRRVVVEPQAQQDVGVDPDHRPEVFGLPRAVMCLSRRCWAILSSICSTVSALACGDLSRPRIRRASGLTCRALIVLSARIWKSSLVAEGAGFEPAGGC